MKRPRILVGLPLIVALVLFLTMAVPVYAADVGLTKSVTPTLPNVYNLTDTIHYTMSIVNISTTDNITVEAVWDVLPDGSMVYPSGPGLPYVLEPGESQTYTYDWVATISGTVSNTFYANGYQEPATGGQDLFNLSVEKQSTVMREEVGGSASLVNKAGLVAPWAVLVVGVAVAALLVLRKRRQA